MENPYDYKNTIAKASSRAGGDRLRKFYSLCEQQKSVSTRKLLQMVEELHESDRLDAIHFRKLADKIKPHVTMTHINNMENI